MNLKRIQKNNHRQLYAVDSIHASDIAEPDEHFRAALRKFNGITISETEAVEQARRQYVTEPHFFSGD